MHCILSTLFILSALSFIACEQNPNSSDSENFIDKPMAAKPLTTAKPEIVYSIIGQNGAQSIAVMDSNGANQTTIYTNTNVTVSSPNWAPSNSITWAERGTSASSIQACDISVSDGRPVSSNFRTIASITTGAPLITNPVWSSTSTTSKIAFVLSAPTTGTDRSYVCRVSASGGSWDTLYSVPNGVRIAGLSWNPDDSRLALLLNTSSWRSFVIINTSTNAVTDSIPISVPMVTGGSKFEWSRTGLNKLAFVSDGKIYYITPTSGSSPTTNNVSWAMYYTVTWSPSNSHLMFIKDAGSGGWQLYKNTAQTTTTKQIDRTFVNGEMNWHR